MSRDDILITQFSLCAALLSFLLSMMSHFKIDRALLHSFLIFIFSYSIIYAAYLFYQHVRYRMHRMELEAQKRLAEEKKAMRENSRRRSATERLGLE
jgi:hypothetical protein